MQSYNDRKTDVPCPFYHFTFGVVKYLNLKKNVIIGKL